MKSTSSKHRRRSLAETVGFGLLGPDLGEELKDSLRFALAGGAVFVRGNTPLSIFRQALSASIRDIKDHPRGWLLQDFLRKGPYEAPGEFPAELVDLRLSDAETAAAITFIFSHMINCFKGAVTELLATQACLRLLKRLQQNGILPASARLFIGDSVLIHRAKGEGFLKGADLHILIKDNSPAAPPNVTVAGVVEVKSYSRSGGRLRKQLNQHVRRATRGLWVAGVNYPGNSVRMGHGTNRRIIRITVAPSDWKLPRSFRFVTSPNGRRLRVDRGTPPRKVDEITHMIGDEWRIRLKWSKEMIAEAAYEMTFWYMQKIGEVIYSKTIPKGWEEMSPAEAGRNAAKMMLYYAILRCRTVRDEQRAIALYNAYGFGYAIGMNYKNAEGRREMLWPQDLDEILSAGKTNSGCYLT